MIDIYLKAPDLEILYLFLEEAGVVSEGENGYYVSDSHKFALDVIGKVHKPTGVMLETEYGDVPEMVAIDGCHANLRVMTDDFDPELLQEITIEAPSAPVRGWA
jgi:hypothetical protein